MPVPYDALLIVGFGGPEGPDEVMPFLENVTRGKPVPRERLLEVAEHYQSFGGVSPINQQVRDLIHVLRPALIRRGIDLPIFWGNRNWHPLLTETIQAMVEVKHQRVLAFVLAGFSSYSSCRQYRENIEAARQAAGPTAPAIDKVRVFFNHPDFIEATTDRVANAIARLSIEGREAAHIAFTAHSIPMLMADNCKYAAQLTETARLVAEKLEIPADRWQVIYQSRSGRPTDPWLEPDILDYLRVLKEQSVSQVVIAPIGFLSDHIEVLYDLDDAAAKLSQELGLTMVRAGTVGTHPKFVEMIVDLIAERLATESGSACERRTVGVCEPNHDVCPENCCLYPISRPLPASRRA
ncbi:MAG: ferrochelatase [Planctomycetes bacterium]|nr:ferrochelatase [Planctomycetota bacterium]